MAGERSTTRNLSAHHNWFAMLDPSVLADVPTCSDTESAMEVDDVPVVHCLQRLCQPPIQHRDVKDSIVSGWRVGFVPSGAPSEGNPPTTMVA